MNTREDALAVVTVLRNLDFQAYLAGGCVRDSILKREPKDWDVATNAPPELLKVIFPRHLTEGEAHGVIQAAVYDNYTDVATFRKDGEYIDGRHPNGVSFTQDVEVDAGRRDFTINAMYMTGEGNVLDFHSGLSDLRKGLIRAVGNAAHRMHEDKLRILRAIRFGCELNFALDSDLIRGMFIESPRILEVSWERIRDEFWKILASDNALHGLYRMAACGVLLNTILPEVYALKGVKQDSIHHPEGDVWQHTERVLGILIEEGADIETRFAGLVHDIGKIRTQQFWRDEKGRERISNRQHEIVGATMADEVCKRFKLTNDQRHKIVDLVRWHMKAHQFPQMGRGKQVEWLRYRYINEQILLQHADGASTGIPGKSLREVYALGVRQLEPVVKQTALITGRDLIAAGIPEGKHIGEMLGEIRELQDSGVIHNKEQAIALAFEKLGNAKTL